MRYITPYSNLILFTNGGDSAHRFGYQGIYIVGDPTTNVGAGNSIDAEIQTDTDNNVQLVWNTDLDGNADTRLEMAGLGSINGITGTDAVLTDWTAGFTRSFFEAPILTADGTELDSGTLTAGDYYLIETYETGDDFDNVGGTNETGNIFEATGATPATWTNESVLLEGTTLATAVGATYKVISGSVIYDGTTYTRGETFVITELITNADSTDDVAYVFGDGTFAIIFPIEFINKCNGQLHCHFKIKSLMEGDEVDGNWNFNDHAVSKDITWIRE